MKHSIGEICEAQARLERKDKIRECDRKVLVDCVNELLRLMIEGSKK